MLDNLKIALEEYGQALIDQYRSNLAASGHDATGNLANNLSFTVNVTDGQVLLELNLEDYWKYVEEGRGPGKFPPLESILNWVKIKRILPRESHGKLPTENQLAYLIGRKIAEHGTQGTHDLARAKESLESIFINRLANALTEDFNSQAYEMIKSSGIAL